MLFYLGVKKWLLRNDTWYTERGLWWLSIKKWKVRAGGGKILSEGHGRGGKFHLPAAIREKKEKKEEKVILPARCNTFSKKGGKSVSTCSLQYVLSDSKISLDSFHCNYIPVRGKWQCLLQIIMGAVKTNENNHPAHVRIQCMNLCVLSFIYVIMFTETNLWWYVSRFYVLLKQ